MSLAFLGTAAGSAMLGAGSNLLTNLTNFASNAATNKNNWKINLMNNEFNERMMQKQMDYNTMMWEKQNSYNTPSAQRARLEAAGLNPYMMMNGSNTGNASSVGSSSAASAAPSAPQQAFRADFQGIPDAILKSKQGALLSQQSETQRIDNLTLMQRNLAALTNMQLEGSGKDIQNQIDRIKLSYVDEMERQTLALMRTNEDARREEMNKTIQERLLLEKELSIFDEQTKLEFAQLAANILNVNSRTAYTKQQQIHEIQKMYNTFAQRKGIKISNDISRRAADAIVDKHYNEEYWSRTSTSWYQTAYDWWNKK